MEYLQELKQDNALISNHMHERLDNIYAAHAFGVHEEFQYDYKLLNDYLRKPGRGIGGSLVLRLAGLHSESPLPPGTLTTAAATEVLNAYLLILDDWFDASDYRKGQSTIHKEYEAYFPTETSNHTAATQAIQLGMSALYLANIMLLEEEFPRQREVMHNMQTGALHVTTGNMLEARLAHRNVEPNFANVYKVYANKTGFYSFGSPVTSGLILAKAEPSTIQSFEAISRDLGISFQILDDLMGIFGDPTKTGKPSTDDIREGLHTFLVEMVHDRLAPETTARFYALHGKQNITENEAEEYRHILRKAYVPGMAKLYALSYLDHAKTGFLRIWRSDWNQNVYDYFLSMIDFLNEKIRDSSLV